MVIAMECTPSLYGSKRHNMSLSRQQMCDITPLGCIFASMIVLQSAGVEGCGGARSDEIPDPELVYDQ